MEIREEDLRIEPCSFFGHEGITVTHLPSGFTASTGGPLKVAVQAVARQLADQYVDHLTYCNGP